MNIRMPNKGAAPNRRLRFGPAPWSFGFFMSQGSAVGELGRSAGAQSGLCSGVLNRSQRRERRGASIFVSFVSFRRIAALHFTDEPGFFRVFRVFGGYISSAAEGPAVAAVWCRLAGDDLRMRITTPNQIAALRTCALDFWIFHESALGGR